MRCYICNKEITEAARDPRDGRYYPCDECQSVVEETLEEWEDEVRDVAYGEGLNNG